MPNTKAYGVAKSSLVYLGGASFTAATSQSFNNVFTSTYQNYVMRINISSKSTNTVQCFRLRSGGVDYTTGNYQSLGEYIQINGTGTAFTKFPNDVYIVTSDTGNYEAEWHIMSPQLPQVTVFSKPQTAFTYSGSFYASTGSGLLNTTGQYDGITVFPVTGTMTGNIRIYGIANS